MLVWVFLLTTWVGSASGADSPPGNLIDRFIFGKLSSAGIQPAPISSDSEFLRRIYLDLTGRLPTPEVVTKFLADSSPDKRDRLIDSLFPSTPTPGIGRRPLSRPFLDRWTYFFGDLFRLNVELGDGLSEFRQHIYKALEINLPYNQFVHDLLTAEGMSTWTNGPTNFIARHRVMEAEGFSKMNHEDTADEIAIWSTKLFLGVNTECISCHDGKGHLDKINLWLAARKRADVWRQASFFGKTSVTAVFGRVAEFQVRDDASGYELTTKSFIRVPRYQADIAPKFILTGEPYKAQTGEGLRAFFARQTIAHPQFARTAVNMIWAELMGRGIVDPPFDFDLARQDPATPPPAPWKIQPSHPELLAALADDFRTHNYDLRRLMKTIVKSRAYQLASYYPGPWNPEFEDTFARHVVRRLSAEVLWDAVSQATGIFEPYGSRKSTFMLEAHFCQEYEGSQKAVYNLLKDFGQTTREEMPSERSSMVQAAHVLNHESFLARARASKGSRLESLLTAQPRKSNEEIVTSLFLATISRPPTAEELRIAAASLAKNREQGAEDVLWVLMNRLDFLFNL